MHPTQIGRGKDKDFLMKKPTPCEGASIFDEAALTKFGV
jgi:hypothetical protein